jgi:predicted kinase
MTLQLLALNINVILDLGFYRNEQRQEFRCLAESAGVGFEFHSVEASAEVRRRRVQSRNNDFKTKTVDVSDQMFDWAEAWYEDLDSEELKSAIVIKN